MKALSIRQPWAWMILHAGKDIENRTWPTQVRGRVLVHASKGMTRAEYDEARLFAMVRAKVDLQALRFPRFEEVQRGGTLGTVEIVGCVENSPSLWFQGPFGFVLRDPRLEQFRPMGGQLGFFEVPLE